MHVETDRNGTELVAFAGTALALLSGALPWVKGGTEMVPVAAAVTVLCGVASGAVLLYGGGRTADYAALAGLGGTVGLLAFRAHSAITTGAGAVELSSSADSAGVLSGAGSSGMELAAANPSAGLGVFAAGVAGLALAAAGGHECWTRVSTNAGEGDDAGAEPATPAGND